MFIPCLAACLSVVALASSAMIVPRRWLMDWPFSHILWRGDVAIPEIALTFDDGPHPENTPALLDILGGMGVEATFFVVGQYVERYPSLVSRIHEEGHLIGNHSFSHVKLPLFTGDRMITEIVHTGDVIEEYTGVRPRYFRPPHGLRDMRLWRLVKLLNMCAVMWTVMPWDWRNSSEDAIIKKILGSLENGGIITLHDGGGRRTETLKAVKKLVPAIRQRGFAFVTIDRMAEWKQ